MIPDTVLAGWVTVVAMGLVVVIKKLAPAMKGWQTVLAAGPVSFGVALMMLVAGGGDTSARGLCQAGVMAAIAWPASVVGAWAVRNPKRCAAVPITEPTADAEAEPAPLPPPPPP